MCLYKAKLGSANADQVAVMQRCWSVGRQGGIVEEGFVGRSEVCEKPVIAVGSQFRVSQ